MKIVTLNKRQLEDILANYFGPYVCVTNVNTLDNRRKVRRAKVALGGVHLYFVATRKTRRSL